MLTIKNPLIKLRNLENVCVRIRWPIFVLTEVTHRNWLLNCIIINHLKLNGYCLQPAVKLRNCILNQYLFIYLFMSNHLNNKQRFFSVKAAV